MSSNLQAAREIARLTAPPHFSDEDIEQRAQSIFRNVRDTPRLLGAINANLDRGFQSNPYAKEGTLAEARTIASYALNGIWQGTDSTEADLVHLAALVLGLTQEKS